MDNDKFIIGGHRFNSRFILVSGKYSMQHIENAVKYAEAEIITLAMHRANTKYSENITDYIPKNVTLLTNTSGARNAAEAIRIARLAREMGCGNFIKSKLCVIPNICFRITMKLSRQPRYLPRKNLYAAYVS